MTAVGYDFFYTLPADQWADWMRVYLKSNNVTPQIFRELIDITEYSFDQSQAYGFSQVCSIVLQEAAKYPDCFEEFVLPLAVEKKWSTLGQLVKNVSILDQTVCDTLIGPIWSHPQTVSCFIELNAKIRVGRLFEVHPLLHPKILSHPRLHQKYQMLPKSLDEALNHEYLNTYGQEGIAALKEFGLMDDANHDFMLELALGVDDPIHLKHLNEAVCIDFSFLRSLAETFLVRQEKAVDFYQTILRFPPSRPTVEFIFQDTLERYVRNPSSKLMSVMADCVEHIQWDKHYLKSVLRKGSKPVEDYLTLLIDLLPQHHHPLLCDYYTEGGFDMGAELAAKFQNMVLSQNINTTNTPSSSRRM